METSTKAHSPPSPGEGGAEVRKDIADFCGSLHAPELTTHGARLIAHCESLLAENARLRAELARRDAGGSE